MWEKDVNINEIKEIRTRTTVYFGVGAIKKIDDIAKVLKDKGIDKVIVMSGRNAYKSTGAWDYVEKALKDHGIGYINYAQVTPNPTTDHVNEAAKMAIAALRPVSREQVEKVWSPCNFCAGAKYITGGVTAVYPVSETHQQETLAEGDFDFCPGCGRPITDEAVQMVMERLEALKDE